MTKWQSCTSTTARPAWGVVRVDGDRCVIQVFEGTRGLSLVNNRTVLTGHPMMMDLSPELLGRVLDGLGRPIDGLGDIYPCLLYTSPSPRDCS